MKSITSITITLICILICSSCNHQDKLIGKWERFGDPLAGMTIEITNIGGSFKAEIITSPDNVLERGFFAGDIKWRDIKKIDDNKYEYVDLKKTAIPYSDPIRFQSDNGLARLEFESDTIIKTRIFAKGNENYGAETIWRRK